MTQQPPLLMLVREPRKTGNFGYLYFEGDKIFEPSFKTVERSWHDNKPFVSCVPTGTYKIKRTFSPRHGDTFYLENEYLGVTLNGQSKRTHILFHVANFPDQLHGCIGVGDGFLNIRGKEAVSNSRLSFANFLERLSGVDEARLVIVDGEVSND